MGISIMGKPASLTRWARVFLTPTNATHRQYEALRAYFVDRVPGTEVARRFGYTEFRGHEPIMDV